MYPNIDVYISISPILAYGCLGLSSGAHKLLSHVLPKTRWSIVPIPQLLLQKNTGVQEAMSPLTPQIPSYTSERRRIMQLS